MTATRAERASALERCPQGGARHLRVADTEALRAIAELVDQRQHVDTELTRAVRSARSTDRSGPEIGARLGDCKQAAQRKYGTAAPPRPIGSADGARRDDLDLDVLATPF
jgi:hypothetical protein